MKVLFGAANCNVRAALGAERVGWDAQIEFVKWRDRCLGREKQVQVVSALVRTVPWV